MSVHPAGRFDNFLHRLIPEALLDHLVKGSSLYIRVRTLTMILVLATTASLLATLILVSYHFFWQPEQLVYDWFVVLLTLCFAAQTFLFYRYKNYWLSGLGLGFCYLLAMLLLVILNGGYGSETMVLLLLSPVVFILTVGRRQGAWSTALVIGIGIFLAVLDAAGLELKNHFADVDRLLIGALVWPSAIAGVTLCIAAYDVRIQAQSGVRPSSRR